MKSSIITYIGWGLLASAFILYLYGLGYAEFLSLGNSTIPENTFSSVLATTISSMQALLLTNMGMLLGISVAQPESAVARAIKLNKSSELLSRDVPELTFKEKVQLVCLGVFIIGLISSLIVWWIEEFSIKSNEVVPLVAESGKMFLGVVLAYLTAVVR